MGKILVTGATGNVGKYVVKFLIDKGEEIVVATTNVEKTKPKFNNDIEVVQFDFTKPNTYPSALTNVDRVFLIRPPHLGKPEDLYSFIDFMKEVNIKFVVFLSLMGIEKNPMPPHYKIEKYIEQSGVAYSHIRPGFFMQNISGIHSVEIKEDNKIFIPAGKSKCSFIDTYDIGLAGATILSEYEKHQNTAYTITGSEALDYYQIARILSEVTKKQIRYAKPSYLKYRSYYIKKRGLDKKYVNVTVALYFMTRMGTAEGITDEFYNITGRSPRTFKEFAIENLTAFI